MHNSSAWVAGVALRFKEGEDKDVWIVGRVNGKNVSLSSVDGNLSSSYSTKDLTQLLEIGKICLVVDEGREGYIAFSELHENDQQEVCRRYRYIQAYEKFGAVSRSKASLSGVISKTASEINDDRPPAWNTLNGWIKRYNESGGMNRHQFARHLRVIKNDHKRGVYEQQQTLSR